MTCSCLACRTQAMVVEWAEGRGPKPDEEIIKEVLLRVIRQDRLKRDVETAVALRQKSRLN